MDALYAGWVSRWQAAIDACQRKGGEQGKLLIGPPATTEAVADVESALGRPLSPSFKRVLLDFSAEVEVFWSLPDDVSWSLPETYWQIFSGECNWSLSRMTKIASEYEEWLEVVGVNDPYVRLWYGKPYRLWHGKMAFAQAGNGDDIAFDIEHSQDAPVVYLSHNGGEGHGYCLGNDFIDFIERHSLLGCAGYDHVQMMPFLPDATSGLDTHGENARKWREWFGLDF